MAKTMRDTLLEINQLTREALESDGASFLSEYKIFDLATEALADRLGTEVEETALEAIQGLAGHAVAGEGQLQEVEVLTATETGLGL